MQAAATAGTYAGAGNPLPPAVLIPRWRVSGEATPATDAALVAGAVAEQAAAPALAVPAGLRDLPNQGAAPDPRIRLEECPQPVQVTNPDELLGQAVDAATWTTTHRSFPGGSEWEINSLNAQAWAGHRFEGHFSERVLRQLVNPEGHPLFELRLDLLQYEVLFARFVGVPHNPLSVRHEAPAGNWPGLVEVAPQERGELRRRYRRQWDLCEADVARVELRPQPWTPNVETQHGRDLLHCLQVSCQDYAAGLALYLLPGREHWGGG